MDILPLIGRRNQLFTEDIASHEKELSDTVSSSRFFVIGVAYKPNINDERESPALGIMDIVAHKGDVVSYNNQHIPHAPIPQGYAYQSVELTAEAIAAADCVVLTTKHSAYDVHFVQ